LNVQLANGQTMVADVVLSAIGLRADLSLAQAAGLACERGIVVDAQLQTSVANVYALGDATQYANGRTLPYVMPIMHAAKALAATLAGQSTPVQFPLMPVAIKTPALPLVVAPAAPGAVGQWAQSEPGVWLFTDANQGLKGFALSGTHTSRRAELAKRVV
jgi:rubredoxin-NAD+ reductase